MHAQLDTRLGRSRSRNEGESFARCKQQRSRLTFKCPAEPGETDVSEGSRSCMDADDHVAISVEKVVSADGATQYVGTLTVDDGLPIKLILFSAHCCCVWWPHRRIS